VELLAAVSIAGVVGASCHNVLKILLYPENASFRSQGWSGSAHYRKLAYLPPSQVRFRAKMQQFKGFKDFYLKDQARN